LILGELGDNPEVDVSARVDELIQHLDSGACTIKVVTAHSLAHDLFLESMQPAAKANDMVWLYKSGELNKQICSPILANVISFKHCDQRGKDVGRQTHCWPF
jgi:hypothetical protein